jgi:hypothetical protein
VDLHVGIDIPSHQISQKIVEFVFFGGGVLCNNQNGGLPLPMRFLFFKFYECGNS